MPPYCRDASLLFRKSMNASDVIEKKDDQCIATLSLMLLKKFGKYKVAT